MLPYSGLFSRHEIFSVFADFDLEPQKFSALKIMVYFRGIERPFEPLSAKCLVRAIRENLVPRK